MKEKKKRKSKAERRVAIAARNATAISTGQDLDLNGFEGFVSDPVTGLSNCESWSTEGERGSPQPTQQALSAIPVSSLVTLADASIV